MDRPIRGLIQGRTVTLEHDPGWPDGQTVIVIPEPSPAPDEEGRTRLLRAAGAWAGDDEAGLDRYLGWNRRQHQFDRTEIEE